MKKIVLLTCIILTIGWADIHAQAVGADAPDFEVNLLGGGSFKLSDQAGKVVLVFLFGNTCPTCLAAGPSVETSINQVFLDSINFAAIGVDTWNSSSNEASVTGFRNSTGITFPLAIKAGFVASDYGTTYDRLMVINRDGVLVHKGTVAASNDINNAIQAIEESLAITGTSISESFSEMNVFPNPVSDVLQINGRGETILGLQIFDVTGRQVFEKNLSDQAQSSVLHVSVKSLKTGIYYYSIQVEGKSSRSSGKLIIQH